MNADPVWKRRFGDNYGNINNWTQGFVGRHFTKYFEENGDEVVGVDIWMAWIVEIF